MQKILTVNNKQYAVLSKLTKPVVGLLLLLNQLEINDIRVLRHKQIISQTFSTLSGLL